MKQKLPFSKKVTQAARYESYVVAIILIILVFLDKDISSLAILASLSWGGYRMVQAFYIWMAKHEHLMDKKIEYKKLDLETDELDNELTNLEFENFDADVY